MNSKVKRRAIAKMLDKCKIQFICVHCGKSTITDYGKSKRIADRHVSRETWLRFISYWNKNGGAIITCSCKGTVHTMNISNDCYCGWKALRGDRRGYHAGDEGQQDEQ